MLQQNHYYVYKNYYLISSQHKIYHLYDIRKGDKYLQMFCRTKPHNIRTKIPEHN